MKLTQFLAVIASMLVFTTISLCQQVAPKAAQRVTKAFSVNGKSVQTSLRQIDNRLYVALDDLASSLDGSLTTKATSVNLAVPSSNCSQNTPSSDAGSGVGTVKGTFTYYFNANYGSRPDVGAKVWIVKGMNKHIPEKVYVLEVNRPEAGHFFDASRSELLFIPDASTPTDGNEKESTRLPLTRWPFIAQAVADGSGAVTLPNIPQGEYTVVMQSSHAKGALGRDFKGRFITLSIRIAAGQVVDISKDFGMSED